jgi:hypothetical protein
MLGWLMALKRRRQRALLLRHVMRIVWSVLIGLSLVFSAVWVAQAVMDSLLYSPTEDKQSAFLTRYSPQHVIEEFALQSYSRSAEGGLGASAGREFVTMDRKVEPSFVISGVKRDALLDAVSEDIREQLIADGAEIRAMSGDPVSGYRFAYRSGRNVGTVTIPALVANRSIGGYDLLPEGVEHVAVPISISERWFPRDEAALQASLASH